MVVSMPRAARLLVILVVALATSLPAAPPPAAASAIASPRAPTPTAATASDFPVGWRAYHTYAEMVADIRAVAAAHPDIVQLRSIGVTTQGRALWVAKVSDNVATDEPEPEVLYDGVQHGLEHMGLEMTLHILHWLADGYGTDARVTRIVDSREVWIAFALNPDGAAYDIAGGWFHGWRKNRQPNPGTTAIGTDLNRNYGWHWGCCGLVSTSPSSGYFRGTAPFSTPEARAVRAFVASRVVGGRQQIRAAIDFHESGRLVLWPYGYTRTDVPADMTTQDHAALVAMGRHMAASSGYAARQASDMYVDSGTLRDWLYGGYRIFAYTVELSTDVYRKDPVIATETARNRDAVLYLAEQAGCPFAVLGAAVATARCGAFDDDMEVARGWVVNPDGTDTAPSSGRWARGDPQPTSASGVILQPGTTTSGRYALVTGLAAGSSANSYDLDGRTTIRSAPITLPAAAGQRLTFRWVFSHLANSSTADHLRAIVEAQDGTRTVVWERLGSAAKVAGTWGSASVPLDAWAGQVIRIRFEAADAGAGSTVEAALDDVRVTRPS
jgi:carboxypeptidase T